MTRRIAARWAIAFCALTALFLCLSMSVSADSQRHVWIDEGFEPMCERIPAECEPYKDEPAFIKLDDASLMKLVATNITVNYEFEDKSDQEIYGVREHWAYPVTAADCEDYALEKRRRLVELGFPRRAMLIGIVVVDEKRKEGHAILLVMTDHGELVLDNLTDTIAPLMFRDFYAFYTVQSPKDPRQWLFAGK